MDILYDSFMLFLCSLRERSQVEQLLQYIVEEAPADAEKRRTFKYLSTAKTFPPFDSLVHLDAYFVMNEIHCICALDACCDRFVI